MSLHFGRRHPEPFAYSNPLGHTTVPTDIRLLIARLLPLAERRNPVLCVSSDIRALLLSYSALWTTIPHPKALSRIPSRCDYLNTLVARAGSRPLALEWRYPCLQEYMTGSRDYPVRDTGLSILPRLRTLVLEGSHVAPGQPTFWTGTAPLLETLAIADKHGEQSAHLAPALWRGATVPRLRELKLGDVRFDGPALEPFASVVSLEACMPFDANDGGGWEHLRSWFPNPERLDLGVTTAAPLPPPPPSLHGARPRRTHRC